MKELDVSLDIVSEVLSLSELGSILKQPPDPGSHSRGDRRLARLGAFSETIWSLYSKAPATAPLEEHLRNIKSQFPPERLRELAEQDRAKIKEVFIDIGIFFELDTFPQALLTREDLQLIQDYGGSLRVVCYPHAAEEAS